MNVYISLPITGKDPAQVKKIAEAAKLKLEKMGHNPISPIDICPKVAPYSQCMGLDIMAILESDAIFLCNGYEKSRGCKLELCAAEIYKKQILIDKDL